jgi:hypothetical protein
MLNVSPSRSVARTWPRPCHLIFTAHAADRSTKMTVLAVRSSLSFARGWREEEAVVIVSGR